MSFRIEPSPPPPFIPDPRLSRVVRMVMRLSGGRIRDERQANMALLIFSAVIFFLALIVFVTGLR